MKIKIDSEIKIEIKIEIKFEVLNLKIKTEIEIKMNQSTNERTHEHEGGTGIPRWHQKKQAKTEYQKYFSRVFDNIKLKILSGKIF